MWKEIHKIYHIRCVLNLYSIIYIEESCQSQNIVDCELSSSLSKTTMGSHKWWSILYLLHQAQKSWSDSQLCINRTFYIKIFLQDDCSTVTCIILDWCHLCFWSYSHRLGFHRDLYSPCHFALKASQNAHLLECLLTSTKRLQFPIIYSFRYFSLVRILIQIANYFGLPQWLNHPFDNIRKKHSDGLKPYENVHWYKLTKGIKLD